MSGKETTRRERIKFQSFMRQEMPDAVVRIICDISICMVDSQFLFMPDDSVHPRYRNGNRPSEFGFSFHGHGIIWHPYVNRRQIGSTLRDFYPGHDHICFSNPLPVTENKDGYLSGGIEGWGEYAGKEMTKVDLPFGDPNNDNYAAIQSMLLIRKSWRRSARKISFNDRMDNVLALQHLSSGPISISSPPMEPDDEFMDISHGAKAPITSSTLNIVQ